MNSASTIDVSNDVSLNETDEAAEASRKAIYKHLSQQLSERTSTAQEFFDIKVIELSDNPNTPGMSKSYSKGEDKAIQCAL